MYILLFSARGQCASALYFDVRVYLNGVFAVTVSLYRATAHIHKLHKHFRTIDEQHMYRCTYMNITWEIVYLAAGYSSFGHSLIACHAIQHHHQPPLTNWFVNWKVLYALHICGILPWYIREEWYWLVVRQQSVSIAIH